MAQLPDKKLRTLYSSLGEATLELTVHEADKKKAIKDLLLDRQK
jgi:hypothetical protein